MATLRSRFLFYAVAASLLSVAAALPVGAQQWLPPIQKVPHLFVQTEVLGVRGGKTRSLGKGTIEASPGRPGTLTLRLDLGPASADHPTAIVIEVTQNEAGDPKIGLTVATTVEVTSRTGAITRVRRERIAEVDEGRSFFHQAYENAGQGTSVLLTMTPDTRIVPQVVKPSVSAPIVFNVSLSRVTPKGDVPLEDNVLRTLESSPVSYAFRIARAPVAPVEDVASTDVPTDAAAPVPGQEAAPSASSDAAPATDGTKAPTDASAQSPKDTKTKKAKPKKMSRKEREKEALAQFQRAREAQEAASAAGSTPAEGSATTSGAAASAGAVPPSSATADGSPTRSASGSPPRPAAESAAGSAHAPAAGSASAPASRPPAADELELTLLPHRVESGILVVDASLRGRAPGATGTERATLVQRTHAVTPNGSFDITVSGLGPAGTGSYKFSVQARF